MQGYRTVVFNCIMLVFLVVRVLNPEVIVPDTDQINEWLNGIDAGILALTTIGNIILRAITSAPIFNRQKKTE